MTTAQSGLTNLIQFAIDRFQAGDAEAAKSACEQVISQDPGQPVALNLLAVLARNSKQWGKAEEIARFGLEKNPQSAQLANTLGLVLLDRRKLQDAEEQFQRANVLKPNRPDYLSNLGLTLQHQGRWEEALEAFSMALDVDANFMPARSARASVASDLAQFDTATADVNFALKNGPKTPDLLNSMAKLALCQGDLDAAYKAYDAVVSMTNGMADAHVNRGLIRLLQGRVSEGWDDYRMRRRRRWGRPSERYSQVPLWQGESLSGKSILVWCEQGLGEAILCASRINDLADQADTVVLECDPRLVDLFQRSLPGVMVVPVQEQPHPDIVEVSPTLQVPIVELLAQGYQASLERIRASGYLKADPMKSAALKEKYAEASDTRLLVGLAWGSPNAATAREKGVAVKCWAPILDTPGVTFVNLQYGESRSAMADSASKSGATLLDDLTIDLGGAVSSQADQIAALDLVITVSNTTAHISGALGQETWVLVPPIGPGSMWYWFTDRGDSPWYGSVELLRRQMNGDDSFMVDVSTKLKDWVSQKT
jgi:Tfp pilus assembly protein PilF